MRIAKKYLFLLVTVSLVVALMAACGPTPEPVAAPEATEVEKVETVAAEVEATAAPSTGEDAKQGGKVTWIVHQEVKDFDPVRATWAVTRAIVVNIFEPLLRYTSDMNLEPALATSWEVSEDGKTYTFHLREGVKFHDGTPFTADAVKAQFDRIVDPAADVGGSRRSLQTYESSEVIDDHTIAIHLTDPTPSFLVNMANGFLGIVSPTAVEKWGEDFGVHPVGTGPFMFKEFVPGSHLTLVKNPDYNWGGEMWDHQGPAYLDELRIEIVEEEGTRLIALESGEADVIERVARSEVERIQADPKFQVIPNVIPGVPQGQGLNVTMPPTDELAVRQAIEYAVDRDAIVDAVYFGMVPPASAPLSKLLPDYDPVSAEMYPYDPEKAKELLEGAGWVDSDGDGIREKDGQKLHLIAYYEPTWQPYVETLAAYLSDVGFEMEISTPGNAAVTDARVQGSIQLLPVGSVFDEPSALSAAWHSKNLGTGLMACHLNSPELDAILDEALIAATPERAHELYVEFQRFVMENALFLPMHELVMHTGLAAEVQGLKSTSNGFDRWFYDVYLEE